MNVIALTRGPWRTNAYLVSDGAAPDALLLDPVEEGEGLVAEAERRGLRPVIIVATHSHADHVGGVAGAKTRLDLPFLIGAGARDSLRAERERAQRESGLSIPEPPEPDRLLREGDIVAVGALRLAVLDTPGHWRGDISLYEPTERAVFCGDTLGRGFINNINRGCDVPLLLQSIRTRLLTLPDDTTVYPGHGPPTTIGHERRHNPALQS